MTTHLKLSDSGSVHINTVVYLIDNDPSILTAIRLALARKKFNVITFDSAHAFLESYKDIQPSILISDIKMPKMNGLELQQTMIDKNINIPIIFVTGHGDVPKSVKAFKAGAFDFIEKPFEQSLLLDSTTEAMKIDVARFSRNVKCKEYMQRLSTLSPREHQIMDLLLEGHGALTNKMLGQRLNISYRTVEGHRKAIMEKMATETIAELIENNLIYKH